jgi:outer membrane protein OmpA-like peptidoglycan-associated protein
VSLPKSSFVLRVVDEVGASVDDISVVFQADGAERTMRTDGAGMARLDGVLASAASVRLGSLQAVRDKLKPRWKEPRDPNIPEGDGVVVREIGDEALDAIALDSDQPTTLVLTPYFQCHEIPGAHFEFGRSFVRSEALDVLADIAQALSSDEGRKGIVFGHTDLAGPEALNKELSERRAKALYALLTQDADAWEELYSGSADGKNWHEKWDIEEIQHMLIALGVTDDAGQPIQETNHRDKATKEAVKKFQSGDYPDRPAEQAPLAADGDPGPKTRKELFLAYAKRVSRKPVDADRLTKIGGAKFMGCGEFNPLSLTVKDEASRRAVIFVYDPAAEPTALPCKLRSLGPCKANTKPLPKTADPSGKPPYRCKVYQEVAKKCPCQAGPDLSHDLVLRFPLTLEAANQLTNSYTLDSDDGTIHQERSLASDARADDGQRAVIAFEHLPSTHSYRLTGTTDDGPEVLFDFTTLTDLLTRFTVSDDDDDDGTDDLVAAWSQEDADGDGDDDDDATASNDDGSSGDGGDAVASNDADGAGATGDAE